MADRTADETRHVMHCFFDSMRDTGHKPQNIREVLREWGFEPTADAIQHPSTRPRDVDAVRRETWIGPTGKQVHGLVNRNPAPDAAAPALMSETTTILFGGGPVGYAQEDAPARPPICYSMARFCQQTPLCTAECAMRGLAEQPK
jgi:hypothetical protein